MNTLNIKALQIKGHTSKEENLKSVRNALDEALSQNKTEKLDLVVLPEMFICPYKTDIFPKYAEVQGAFIWSELSSIADEYDIYLVAGSVPELLDDKIYNTSYVFDRSGSQIAKHQKMHLFDIDIEGGQRFKESDTLSAGSDITVFDTEFGKIGLCICYDIRFPELSRLMVDEGAKMIIIPAAFNMTTGPEHWEILFRTRAVDNQVYMLGVAPARDISSDYVSYANSIIVSPFGKVIERLDDREAILDVTIDLDDIYKVREGLPLLKHRRKDIYTLNANNK